MIIYLLDDKGESIMDIEKYNEKLFEPVELPTGAMVTMRMRPGIGHYNMMSVCREEHFQRVADATEAKPDQKLLNSEFQALTAKFGRESMAVIIDIAKTLKITPDEATLPFEDMDGLDQAFLIGYVQNGIDQMNKQIEGKPADDAPFPEKDDPQPESK